MLFTFSVAHCFVFYSVTMWFDGRVGSYWRWPLHNCADWRSCKFARCMRGLRRSYCCFFSFGKPGKWLNSHPYLRCPWEHSVSWSCLSPSSVSGCEGGLGRWTSRFLRSTRTVLSLNDARTRMAEDTDRASWYEQVWRRMRSSKVTLIVGEGFGEPLIDFKNEEGIPVRQPHNSSLSVLARLGLVGLLVWLVFLVSVTRRFVHAIRRRVEADDGVHQLVLWLFFFFVLAMIQTSVQPALEFSHGAIPFYFLVGFALGVMRWQVEGAPRALLP